MIWSCLIPLIVDAILESLRRCTQVLREDAGGDIAESGRVIAIRKLVEGVHWDLMIRCC